MSQVLTVCQVAERWGCSANAVRKAAQHGHLRHFRVGRLYRFREAEIEVFESGSEIEERDGVKVMHLK